MFAVDLAAAIAAAIAFMETYVDPRLAANPEAVYLTPPELAEWRTAEIERLALALVPVSATVH